MRSCVVCVYRSYFLFIIIICRCSRLLAHKTKSRSSRSPRSSLEWNTSPEPDGLRMENCTCGCCCVKRISVVMIDSHSCVRSSLSLSSAWAVLLDRSQQKLQLVLLPPALFLPVGVDDPQWAEHVEAMPEGVQPFIIYEEITDIWINVR